MIVTLLKKSHFGLTKLGLRDKLPLRRKTLSLLLKELVEEKKIKKLEFGNTKLYKVMKNGKR